MLQRSLGNLLIENQIIESTQLPIFNYGYLVAKLLFANLFAAIIISIFFNTTLLCIAFLVFFSPLRRFSGGFHAGRAIVCFFESQGLILLAQILAKNLSPNYYIFYGLIAFICAIIILIKSPIYSKYKPLTDTQIRVYGRYARILTTVYLLIAALCCIFRLNSILVLILCALFFQTVLLFIPERDHVK